MRRYAENSLRLEKEKMVGRGSGHRGVAEEDVEERVAVAGEKWKETQGALLKAVVGIERVGELLLMSGKDTFAGTLGAASFFAKAEELIADFLLGSGERTEKSLVEFANWFAEASKKAADGFFTGRKA